MTDSGANNINGSDPRGPDDAFDADAPFDLDTPLDPAECAMHGILLTLLDGSAASDEQYAARLIDALGRGTRADTLEPGARAEEQPEPRASARAVLPGSAGHAVSRRQRQEHGDSGHIRDRLRRHRGKLGTAGACLIVVLAVLFFRGGGDSARALDLREIGYAPPLPMAEVWPAKLDDEAARAAEERIAAARIKLSSTLEQPIPGFIDPWIPWTQIYRGLRSLGRWEEAIDEALAFTEYARTRNAGPEGYTMYYTALADTGKLYLAIGDYENAKTYLHQACVEARNYHEWSCGSASFRNPRPHFLKIALAGSVGSYLGTLTAIASGEEDQEAAWALHRQAEALLTDYFANECVYRELDVADGASLYELCMAVATVADADYETPATLTRQHLLREASLLRVDRKADEAARLIERIDTIPYYPGADDLRQDFWVLLERVRIAIAQGDFPTALAAAKAAEVVAGPVPLQDSEGRDRTRDAVGPLARAELIFLRGVVLNSASPGDTSALFKMESAMEILNQSAAVSTEGRRRPFLRRFEEWNRVTTRIRRKVPTERRP